MRPRTVFSIVAAASVLLVVACSSTLDINDYDRSCAVNEDCEIVFVGDVCDCSCDGQGAIAKKARPAYVEDRSKITCSNQCGACANDRAAICTAGTCQAQRCAGQVKRCASECGGTASVTACECPSGMIDVSQPCTLDGGSGSDGG